MSGSPKYEYFIVDSLGSERIVRADSCEYYIETRRLKLFLGERPIAVFNGISSFTEYELAVSVAASE